MRAPWKPDRLGEAGEENPSATSYCRGDLSECDHALERRRSQLMGTRARMADETRCTYQSRLRACGVRLSPTSAPRSPTASRCSDGYAIRCYGESVRRRRDSNPRFWAARHLGIVGPRAWAVVPIPARLGWTRRLDIDRRLFYDDWRHIVVRRRIVPIRVWRAPPPRYDINEAVAAVDMVSTAVPAAAPPAPAPPFTWRHRQQ